MYATLRKQPILSVFKMGPVMKDLKSLWKCILYAGPLLPVCTACTPDSKGVGWYPPPLISSVCINITPQQLTDYLVFDVYQGDENTELFGYNPINSSLDVFSLANRSVSRVIPLNQTGPTAVKDVIAIKVISLEVVWFATLNEFIVYDLERSAVHHRISLSNLNDKFSLANYAYFFENHGELVPLSDTSVLVQAGVFPFYNGSSSLHLSVMNVNSGKIVELPVDLPEWVDAANHFGALNAIQFGYSNGIIHYNFPFSDSLYRYRVADGENLSPVQYDSPNLPTVLKPYAGSGEIETLIDYASASSFYMGFQRVVNRKDVWYRFLVESSEEPPLSYTTKLEIFIKNKPIARHEICQWCKTRSFPIGDTIFIFKEGISEEKLCFETVQLSLSE